MVWRSSSSEQPEVWHLYLEAGPQTVGVVSAVTAVTQQHVVCVSFTPADPAASVEDRAGPEDASLQSGQVHKHLSRVKKVKMLHVKEACLMSANQSVASRQSDLRQTGAGLQRLSPALQHRPMDTPTLAAI